MDQEKGQTESTPKAEGAQQPAAQPSQPSQPAGQQPEKKSNAWKWILGGCIVIVVIAAIAIGGCVYYAGQQTEQIIDELENIDFEELNDFNFNFDDLEDLDDL